MDSVAATQPPPGADPISVPLRWVRDHLEITDPDTLQRVDRTRLSPSTAESVGKCPAGYVIDRLSPDDPDPFAATSLGTAAHTVLEQLHLLAPERRTRKQLRHLLTELAAATATVDPTPADPARRLRWQSAVWRRSAGLFAIEDPSHTSVRGAELTIDDVAVDGVPFRGIIDRVDIDPTTSAVTVVDYKSGKVTSPAPWGDGHGDQLRTYAAALAAKDGVSPAGARILYTRYGTARAVSLEPRAMRSTLIRFGDAWTTLRASVDKAAFRAQASKLCGWCPLVTSCPVAHRAGHTVPAPTATATPVDVPVHTPLRGPAGRAPADAATYRDEGNATTRSARTDTNTGGPGMPTHIEDKPWIEAGEDGSLNPNSYAAQAVFGLTELAVETLSGANQELRPHLVAALAKTFAKVVLDAQERITETRTYQAGINQRLRGALRTTLETMPPPAVGAATAADWADWIDRATRRVHGIATTAFWLWASKPSADGKPWSELAAPEDADNITGNDNSDQAAEAA